MTADRGKAAFDYGHPCLRHSFARDAENASSSGRCLQLKENVRRGSCLGHAAFQLTSAPPTPATSSPPRARATRGCCRPAAGG